MSTQEHLCGQNVVFSSSDKIWVRAMCVNTKSSLQYLEGTWVLPSQNISGPSPEHLSICGTWQTWDNFTRAAHISTVLFTHDMHSEFKPPLGLNINWTSLLITLIPPKCQGLGIMISSAAHAADKWKLEGQEFHMLSSHSLLPVDCRIWK